MPFMLRFEDFITLSKRIDSTEGATNEPIFPMLYFSDQQNVYIYKPFTYKLSYGITSFGLNSTKIQVNSFTTWGLNQTNASTININLTGENLSGTGTSPVSALVNLTSYPFGNFIQTKVILQRNLETTVSPNFTGLNYSFSDTDLNISIGCIESAGNNCSATMKTRNINYSKFYYQDYLDFPNYIILHYFLDSKGGSNGGNATPITTFGSHTQIVENITNPNGNLGASLYQNGVDYDLDTTITPDIDWAKINGTRNLTIGLWAKLYCYASNSRIIDGEQDNYISMTNDITAGGCALGSWLINLNNSGATETLFENTLIYKNDTWVFLVAEYNGSNFCGYINDTLISCDASMSRPYTPFIIDTTTGLGIGSDYAAGGRWFSNGYIDEIFVCSPMCNRSALYDLTKYKYTTRTQNNFSNPIVFTTRAEGEVPPADTTAPSGNITTIVNNSIFNSTKLIIGVKGNETGTAKLIVNYTVNQTASYTIGTNLTFITNFSNGTYRIEFNLTDGTNIGTTPFFNITIANNTGVEATTTCDCPASGNWEISDASTCYLTTTCDIPTQSLRINDGALRILSGGYLRANGCYVKYDEQLYVDSGGGLSCRIS